MKLVHLVVEEVVVAVGDFPVVAAVVVVVVVVEASLEVGAEVVAEVVVVAVEAGSSSGQARCAVCRASHAIRPPPVLCVDCRVCSCKPHK